MVFMKRLVAFSSALMLVACDLSPEFSVPKTEAPTVWKEVEATDGLPVEDGNWKKVDEASFDAFGQGTWWKLFADSRLDALIDAGMQHSPTLEAARERLVQARQQEDIAESSLWPEVTGGAGANRQRQSSANPNIPPGMAAKPYTLYRAQLGVDYGLDIFGRARNALEAAEQRGEAERALLRATQLTLQADIAEHYFTLLALTEEETMLARSILLRKETLGLARKRYEIGEVSDLDVARAETELATTEADIQSVSQQRAVTEHLLATLTGKAPADFIMPDCVLRAGSTDSCDLMSPPPQIPAGLPSSLLERRPDIARAAHELAARNAQIGVARAAFFPSIDLTASFGYESSSLGSLTDWSSRTWLLGPVSGTFMSLPIFTGGRNTANLLLSKSAYREQVATYRGTVLTAFREVEDSLAGIRTARERGLSQGKALAAGRRAYRIARLQYDSGYTDYLTLIDAERSLIAAARGEVQARGLQYVSTVTLIRALGGGWGDVKDGTSLMPASAQPAEKPKESTKKPVAAPAPAILPKGDATRTPPKRLPRPWDAKAKARTTEKPLLAHEPKAAPALAPVLPEIAPAPQPKPLPFRKRNPRKPVPGLEETSAIPALQTPVSGPQDLDTENAPENTILPFRLQNAR